MKSMMKLMLAASALTVVSPAYAATYYLNQNVGGFAVTGQIVTDGTIGELSGRNITGYSFTFQNQTFSATDNSLVSQNGFNLVASATNLTYNFNNNDGYFYFNLLGGSYYCLQNNGCYDFTGSGIGIRGQSFASSPRTGIVTIATAAAGAVPETATWAMMIAGFGMMGAAMRTRRRSTKVSFA